MNSERKGRFTMAFTMPLPDAVVSVLETLRRASYRAYVVGGSVRDAVMGLVPEDFDLTTSASPENVKALFSASHRVIDTGLKHGTVTVLSASGPVEITTFRVDGAYTDARRPDSVAFTTDLRSDLKRRDFTVNALAYNPTEGLIDCFGGLSDLHAGTIRCIGNPHERFSEDALRILRALRFSVKLDFSIEPETAEALIDLRGLLSRISAERVTAELEKIFASTYPERLRGVLTAYRAVFGQILPETAEIPAYETVCAQTTRLSAKRGLRLAYYLLCTGVPEHAIKHLRLPCSFSSRVLRIGKALKKAENAADDFTVKLLLYEFGTDICCDAAGILRVTGKNTDLAARIVRLIESGACVTLDELALNGSDLLALGVRGPRVGELLHKTLMAVMRGELENKHDILLDFVKHQIFTAES